MKDYIKNVDEIEIEFVENYNKENNNSIVSDIGAVKSKGVYWKIILKKISSSYIENAQFNIDYYTGEILFGEVILQLNVD